MPSQKYFSYEATLNPFHFKVAVGGIIYNIWPTKDKYALVAGGLVNLGAEEFLRAAYPTIDSYLNHYISVQADGYFTYLKFDGTQSTPYQFRDECLFNLVNIATNLNRPQ